ncbi:MAG TPA: glycosyltransferase family 2 protein [Gemmatimonadaceae bacterium]|nr:glycosyltransferase family 2 protein [Gemmatimonadaceae bacterium]
MTHSSGPPAHGESIPLTVVVPTLNEAAQIGDAVAALGWADEVIVVDGGSADDTVQIAQAAGARVLCVSTGTIAAQRNAGIAAARNTWILALDADERVSPQLSAEIGRIVAGRNATHAAYQIKFRNRYLGRELRYGPWGRDWHIRLFTRERRYVSRRVHERLEPIEDVGTLAGAIIHRPYRDLPHHLAKVVKYTRWGAADLRERGQTATVADIALRPAWRFARDYVVMSGWRDGMPGFIAATLSAFAVFLKYALLYTGSMNGDA